MSWRGVGRQPSAIDPSPISLWASPPKRGRGEAEEQAHLAAQVEVLGALHAVEVALDHEAVAHRLEAHPGVGEGAVGGSQEHRLQGAAGAREDVARVGEAGLPAVGRVADQAGRQAAVDLDEIGLVMEVGGDLPRLVEVLQAVVVVAQQAERPAGVERVEGLLDLQALPAAVAVVGVGGEQADAAPQQVRILEADQIRGAVDRADAGEVDLLAGAQEVAVLEREARAVAPAGAAEGGPPRESPDVARRHLDVDLAVVAQDGADVDVVEVVVGAQQPRRLLDQLGGEDVPRLEQELLGDHPGAGGAMEVVGEVEEAVPLAGIGRIEDVLGRHPHLADHAPRRDLLRPQHPERRRRLGRARRDLRRDRPEKAGRRLCVGGDREEGEDGEEKDTQERSSPRQTGPAFSDGRAAAAAARDHAKACTARQVYGS